MSTVRKLITFPAQGAKLLEGAIAGAHGRAAGDYLTAVLRQRHKAWVRALSQFVGMGFEHQKIFDALESAHGMDPDFMDRENLVVGGAFDTARALLKLDNPYSTSAFCDLLLEFNAGNRALIAALEGDETK